MRETFETPGRVLVRVRNRAGLIEVRAEERTTTEVEVTPLDDAPGAAETAAATRVALDGSGGRPTVRVEVPPDDGGAGGAGGLLRRVINFPNNPRIHVRVFCPAGTSALDVETASASVDAAGLLESADVTTASGEVELGPVAAALRVRTASGDVQLASVGGDARVETASGGVRAGRLEGPATVHAASGDVRVDSAGSRIDVHTASGDVMVREAAAGCEVRTASGDQVLERLAGGQVRLDTVSGDIVAGIAKGTNLEVDAQTLSGDLRSEIPLDEERSGGEGGSTVELRVRTVSGDLQLRRAP